MDPSELEQIKSKAESEKMIFEFSPLQDNSLELDTRFKILVKFIKHKNNNMYLYYEHYGNKVLNEIVGFQKPSILNNLNRVQSNPELAQGVDFDSRNSSYMKNGKNIFLIQIFVNGSRQYTFATNSLSIRDAAFDKLMDLSKTVEVEETISLPLQAQPLQPKKKQGWSPFSRSQQTVSTAQSSTTAAGGRYKSIKAKKRKSRKNKKSRSRTRKNRRFKKNKKTKNRRR